MILPDKIFCPGDGCILNSMGIDNFRKCANCGGVWQIDKMEIGSWVFIPAIISADTVSLKVN